MAKAISFEQSITSLEVIVQHLERGDLDLSDALKQFEKGIQLAHTCQTTLTDAEKKIEALTAKSLKQDEGHE